MKIRPRPAGENPSNGNRWFLTYSDMITLLLALFIVLYSMASANEKKYGQLVKGFRTALNTESASETGGGKAGAAGGQGVVLKAGQKIVNMDALDQVYQSLNGYISKNHLQDQISLTKSGEYVQVHLKDVVMFQPNTAEMLPGSKPIMREMEEALAAVYDRVDHITISGHTANVVVNSTRSDQISWMLSTQRAVTVLNSLLDYGLRGDKLSIQGYAHYAPIADNSTEEGRAKNRRVEITIYKNPSKDAAQNPSRTSSASSQK
ncbi:MAG TPA: chemotaxis protein MotB [Ruminococcaceae bacterium]|jgi:chemotaxis protein MotB|nr:chemotaxis protein MotB [Oscillospiraceae bacterium]